jgi:hypothetical protein
MAVDGRFVFIHGAEEWVEHVAGANFKELYLKVLGPVAQAPCPFDGSTPAPKAAGWMMELVRMFVGTGRLPKLATQ